MCAHTLRSVLLVKTLFQKGTSEHPFIPTVLHLPIKKFDRSYIFLRFELLTSYSLARSVHSGQCARPGIPKVLGSKPAFSTTHVTCLFTLLNSAKKSFNELHLESLHFPFRVTNRVHIAEFRSRVYVLEYGLQSGRPILSSITSK